MILKHPGICQSAELSPAEFVFSEELAGYCKQNTCGQYGSFWTCPPGAGEVSELRKKILSYNTAFVFTYCGQLQHGFEPEGWDKARKEAKNILRELSGRLREAGEEYTALGCGSCELCEKCTYPSAPCRRPAEAAVSVEACGIDVSALAEKAGLRYNNGENTVTYFCILLTK